MYSPNDDNPTFFENLFLKISSLLGKVEIAGDFNCTMNTTMDRSTGMDSSPTKYEKSATIYKRSEFV